MEMRELCRCCQGNGKWRVYKLDLKIGFPGMWGMVRPDGTSKIYPGQAEALEMAVSEAYGNSNEQEN